jgi:hypothetical protein
MGSSLSAVVVLALAAAVTTGCAARKAPFDALDQSTVTVLRLQQAPQAAMPAPGGGGLPLIPGIPPELQQAGQAVLQQLQQQGIIPPGLIPGMPGANPAQPPQQQFQPYPNDPQWVISDQRPVVDDKLRDELLDLFGDPDSFTGERGQCWFPGMAVSFQSPNFPQPVDVVVSLSCNQAVGYGFTWPHPGSGFGPESNAKLTQIYQSLFGPVPPGA